jgi:N-dimethylarginine dimethylaminohydrolase
MPLSRPTILMCPPDYYGIEYEINPWMSRSRASDPAQAREQWRALHDLLVSLGVDIRLLTPVQGLPDLVFTANAGLVWHNAVFLSRFRHAARQGETPVDAEWFAANGFRTVVLPDDTPIQNPKSKIQNRPNAAQVATHHSPLHFEGAGDTLFCGETLYGGYIIRSDARALQWVAGEMGCRVIPLQLVDPHYYHLDTCFCPLSATEALWYPAAFDEYGQKAVREHVPELIEVEAEEAARFACNSVVVQREVVHNTGCPRLEAELRQRGYTPHATPLDEFIKAGGSAKCLTLRLDGEDASMWTTA